MSGSALASDAETGMAMSEGDWLRIHYEACAAGYSADLGFELRPDQLKPALPGVRPRGIRRAKPPPPPKKSYEPIDLE